MTAARNSVEAGVCSDLEWPVALPPKPLLRHEAQLCCVGQSDSLPAERSKDRSISRAPQANLKSVGGGGGVRSVTDTKHTRQANAEG